MRILEFCAIFDAKVFWQRRRLICQPFYANLSGTLCGECIALFFAHVMLIFVQLMLKLSLPQEMSEVSVAFAFFLSTWHEKVFNVFCSSFVVFQLNFLSSAERNHPQNFGWTPCISGLCLNVFERHIEYFLDHYIIYLKNLQL
jgi:hypothetical protein